MKPIVMWTVNGHQITVDRSLMPGVAEKRVWSCTCGWRCVGFDNTAKKAARKHLRECAA